MTAFRERAFTFGPQHGLIGILTEPAQTRAAGTPAILLYNVGFNHRVGPYRLNVDLARQLADQGYTTLRFDLSGLGDSAARMEALSEAERGMADARDAMDFVTRKCGIDEFVLIGHCSGVDIAHPLAVTDPRVRGVAFIDGYSYQTPGYRWRQALRRGRRLLSPERYKSWVERRLRRTLSLEIGDLPEIFERDYPPMQQFRTDVHAMLAGGVRVLFINTGNTWFYNHRGQIKEILGVDDLPRGVEAEYWPEADHVFTAVNDRARLVQRLTNWVQACFPARLPAEALLTACS